MLTISLQQLHEFVQSAVEAGVQAYIRSNEPLGDRINQADAKRWIASLGFKPVMLRRWVEAGLLKHEKNGTAQNSQTWYSKAAIREVIAMVKLKRICNDNLI